MSIETAKKILVSGNYTCVIMNKSATIMLSDKRGVLPLMEFIKNYGVKGCILADKVIGKASALLCIKAGFKEVYAHVMSESAEEVLKNSSIQYSYKQKTPAIKNREGTGLCPMENLSGDVIDPDEMYKKINEFLKL